MMMEAELCWRWPLCVVTAQPICASFLYLCATMRDCSSAALTGATPHPNSNKAGSSQFEFRAIQPKQRWTLSWASSSSSWLVLALRLLLAIILLSHLSRDHQASHDDSLTVSP